MVQFEEKDIGEKSNRVIIIVELQRHVTWNNK